MSGLRWFASGTWWLNQAVFSRDAGARDFMRYCAQKWRERLRWCEEALQ